MNTIKSTNLNIWVDKEVKEAEKMEKHPEKYKSYDNVDELFKDILK